MKVLVEKPFLINQLLSPQCVDKNTEYVKSAFNIEMPVNNGMLLYNTLTYKLILLDQYETKLFSSYEKNLETKTINNLISDYFIVPKSQNQALLCSHLLDTIRYLSPKNEITNFTILTTLDCNARCFYCYEHGVERLKMDNDTALAIIEYICKVSKQNPVSLNWFGGEPLYNSDIIDYICSELFKRGITFSSTMVSNGYLFDKNMVFKACNDWKLKKVQITLDGTRKIYNKIKAYIYDNIDPFETVINNIEELLSNDVRVAIRLNITKDNVADLYDLIDYLDLRFENYKNFYIYSGIVVDYNKIENIWGSRDRNEMIKIHNKLEEYILNKGLKNYIEPHTKVRTYSCIADNPSFVAIAPNGDLCSCEHYSSDAVIGSVFNSKTNNKLILDWQQYFSKNSFCNNCVCLPICHQIKFCPSNKGFICNEFERELRINSTRMAILNKYHQTKIADKE